MDPIQTSPAVSVPPPVSELQTPPPSPKPKLNSRLLLVIATLTGLLLASFAVVFVLQAQQNNTTPTPVTRTTPSPTPTPDPTANWKTYTNEKYGYSIKYPSDKLTSCPHSIQGFSDSFDLQLDKECLISEPAVVISILAFDAPQPELTSPYPQCYTFTKESIKTGDINGYKYSPVIKKETDECTMTSYGLTDQIEFDHNKKHFSIRVFETEEKNSYQILFTFKFTDQTSSNSAENVKNLPKEQCGCWDGVNNTCLSQSACL